MARNIISLKFSFKEDYKYPFFLFSLLSLLFIPSFFGLNYEDILTNVLFIILIISSLTLISSNSKIIRFLTWSVGITGIASQIFHLLVLPLGNLFQVIFIVLLFIYFILIFGELIGQIFQSGSITLNVVLGAFTGYVLIGIIGYFVFRIIFLLDPSAFSIEAYSQQELIYFSFITLTTIGYGDIAPLSEPARNFAIILGLTGQFYNSIIIAIIIGKFLQK